MATNQTLIHYALDLETPPVIACGTPSTGAITSPTASEVTCPRCLASEHFPRMAAQPRQITAWRVLRAASLLLTDIDDANPEYDKAIIDLTSDLIGAGWDDKILMARILRAISEMDN